MSAGARTMHSTAKGLILGGMARELAFHRAADVLRVPGPRRAAAARVATAYYRIERELEAERRRSAEPVQLRLGEAP